jgi:hypothetical protein
VITEEERQSIIDEAVEKALLALPNVIGNLILNQISLTKLMREFYSKNPELSTSKDIVSAMLEKVEGENPGIEYPKIIDLALPLIRQQLQTINKTSFTPTNRPNRDLSQLKIVPTQNNLGNGEL